MNLGTRSVNDLLGPKSRMLFAVSDGANSDVYYWNDESGNRDGDVQAAELLPLVQLNGITINRVTANDFIA